MKKYALLALLLLAAGPTRAALPANILDHLSSPDLGKRYKADMALRALVSEAGRPGADAAQRAALEKDLLDLAADDRQPETTRIAALVQMPYFGTAAAVPVLAGLLEDSRPAIREYARRGLRNNPDPGASEPLRRALEKASDPTWELGLMQALRHRGDTDSVPLLTARLASSNDAVAGLAAEALGEFGPETSVSALADFAGSCAPRLRATAQSALIRAAQRAGDAATIAGLWPAAAGAGLSAEIFGTLLALGDAKAAAAILADVLQHPEAVGAVQIVYAAVLSARPALEAPVLADLPALPERARLAAHAALAARRETKNEADLLALAAALDGPLRETAVNLLGSCGTAKSLDFLAAEAQSKNPQLAAAAASSLGRLHIDGLDARLLEQAAGAPGDEQTKALQLLAVRNPAGTEKLLIELAGPASPPALRDAALAAMEKVGGLESCRALIRWVAETPAGGAAKPYQAACRRLSPRVNLSNTLWAETFAPAYDAATPDKRADLLVLVPGLAGMQSGRTPAQSLAAQALVEWIKTGHGDREALLGQLLAIRDFDVGPYLIEAAAVPELDPATRLKIFQAATRLLYPNVNAKPPQKARYAAQLLQAAPPGEIKTLVETSVKEAQIPRNR